MSKSIIKVMYHVASHGVALSRMLGLTGGQVRNSSGNIVRNLNSFQGKDRNGVPSRKRKS